MEAIKITDTGLDEVGGNVLYNQVNGGSAIQLFGFKIDFKFPVNSTEHQTLTLDENNDLTFVNNEVSSISSPIITLKGILDVSDQSTITNMLNLRRTQGIKTISGGLGVIGALPEATSSPKEIYVIVKNIQISETLRNSRNTAEITIELEQVN